MLMVIFSYKITYDLLIFPPKMGLEFWWNILDDALLSFVNQYNF